MPTTEDRDRNIKNVITAAIRCFKEHGIVDTSQIMIARTAGLSPRSVQRYFASKTKLVREVVEYAVDDHCQQLLNKYMAYDQKNHTGLENLICLIKLHGSILEQNLSFFSFLAEADIYLRHQKINGDAMLMSIPSVDELKMGFESAFLAGIEDGSIKKEIDVEKECNLLNIALTGLLYQIGAHTSYDKVDEFHKLQQENIDSFALVWANHLKRTIR